MEFNKIAAAILLTGLIGMTTGKAAAFLYGGAADGHHAGEHHEVARGYSIEVPEGGVNTGAIAKKDEGLPSIIPLLANADVAAGEAFFSKKCTLCHGIEKGGAHKTGPNLWNIVNAPKGAGAGFNYSKAIQAKGGNWEFDELNGFLHKPKKWLKGTIMAFAGIKKEQDRANLIAYLRTQSDSPAAIPAAPAEAAALSAEGAQ